MAEKNRPSHTIRYGSVKAVVWKNKTSNGHMFNVTVARLYKDGDEWKESTSFGSEDLPLLAKALNDCHTWIESEKAEQRASATEKAA